jgi:hypothetical protein
MPKKPKSSSATSFDTSYWAQKIKSPDWYLELVPYFQKQVKNLENKSAKQEQFRKTVRKFFEAALKEDKVALAESGPDLDQPRMPVDTIVIHHTSAKPGYELDFMNAVQLLNVYAPYFMAPSVKEERGLKGGAIWSGHFRHGKQVFWLYHWLMRMDGRFERLLADEELGWHSGNWEINKKSIAICLDNDYEKICPTDQTIGFLAEHIKQNYPKVDAKNIKGHCECREGTDCPGTHFITEWKPRLLEMLNAQP